MDQEQIFRRYIDDALGRSERLFTDTVQGVVEKLQRDADAALTSRERQRHADLAFALRRSQKNLVTAFVRELEDSLDVELRKALGLPAKAGVKKVDIELALVDEEKVQEDLEVTQLIHQIEAEAEWEIRDLNSRMSALSGSEESSAKHNPLRPEVFGRSVQRAIQGGDFEAGARMDLLRALGGALSSALKQTYKLYNDQLEAQNIRPIVVTTRRPGHGAGAVAGQGGAAGAAGPADAPGGARIPGSLGQQGMHAATAAKDSTEILTAEAINRLFQGESLQGLGWDSGFSRLPGFAASAPGDSGPAAQGGFAASTPGGFARSGHGFGSSSFGSALAANPGLRDAVNRVAGVGAFAGSGPQSYVRAEGVAAQPVNLITQFRDDLMAASSRPLEKLTIDVVAMMFDHILADRRLHPEAKASLGRLQIPVLRIALQDASLFSNRSHPTRRLINRVAAYSSGFQQQDEVSLREFLDAVDKAVETIVGAEEADAQMFEVELERLEKLIATQSQRKQKESSEAVAALERAEFRTLLRRHLSQQIDRLLSTVEVDDFLHSFLRHQWMAVLVECVVLYGESAPMTQQMKQTGSDLLWSVQPKVDKPDRAHLIYLLPRMIRALQDGLNLIEWDIDARQTFFSNLMRTHTQVVRASGHTNTVTGDLEALQERWQRAFDGSLNRSNDVLGVDVDIAVLEKEKSAAQLMDEADIAIEPMLPPISTAAHGAAVLARQEAAARGETVPDEAPVSPEPEGGAISDVRQWIDDLAVGTWMQMRLQGQWATAQLIWRSPQGLFFMFSSNVGGKSHSMTRRALVKLCAEGSVRTQEESGLVDRAVEEVMQRTRKRGESSERARASTH